MQNIVHGRKRMFMVCKTSKQIRGGHVALNISCILLVSCVFRISCDPQRWISLVGWAHPPLGGLEKCGKNKNAMNTVKLNTQMQEECSWDAKENIRGGHVALNMDGRDGMVWVV